MIVNYIKIAFRYFFRNRIFTFINISGLTVSLSCILLIVLFIHDELSFDRFHQDVESQYVISIDVQNPDGSSFDKMTLTGTQHGPRFKEKMPEIEAYVRMNHLPREFMLNKEVVTQTVLLADANFFSFFSFPLIFGDSKTALSDANSIVITEDLSIRFFGRRDALNEVILIEDDGKFMPYRVSGIATRCPHNSSIQFEAVIPLQSTSTPMDWVTTNLTTFVKLGSGSNILPIETKMQEVFEEESKDAMEQVRTYGFTQTFKHRLLPFKDVHLSQEYAVVGGVTKNSNPVYSYVLSGIAFFLLIIACINFINISIARSLKRTKEIGIRKLVGGSRRQLIGQFLGESFLVCFISFISSIVLAGLMLPFFNNLVNKNLSLDYLMDSRLIVACFVILIGTAFLAGFYPAVVLSNFKPVRAIQSRWRSAGNRQFQRVLIVFQFSLATLMMIGTATVYLQFDYLTSKDLGYDVTSVLKLTKKNLSIPEAKVFQDRLSGLAGVQNFSPMKHGQMNGKVEGNIMHFTYDVVGPDYFQVMKIPIIAGRGFFPDEVPETSSSVIINETFAKEANWTEPIGKEVVMMDGKRTTVVGVVADHHYESLRQRIEPQLFTLTFNPEDPGYSSLFIRLHADAESRSTAAVLAAFREYFPYSPVLYEFPGETNRLKYEAESRWKDLISLAAVITIIIACIGLLGLSILTTEGRSREIGIRKVNGATTGNITLLVYKEHLFLILIAFLIAIPFGIYGVKEWLNAYPYRVEPGIGMIMSVCVLILAVVLTTVSYHTFKAALKNPIDVLREQ